MKQAEVPWSYLGRILVAYRSFCLMSCGLTAALLQAQEQLSVAALCALWTAHSISGKENGPLISTSPKTIFKTPKCSMFHFLGKNLWVDINGRGCGDLGPRPAQPYLHDEPKPQGQPLARNLVWHRKLTCRQVLGNWAMPVV